MADPPRSHRLDRDATIGAVARAPDAVLGTTTTIQDARQRLRAGGTAVLVHLPDGDPVGVLTSDILASPDLERVSPTVPLTTVVGAWQLPAVSIASLRLDQAFSLLLSHPAVRWLVVRDTESPSAGPVGADIGIISRVALIPPSLERWAGNKRLRFDLQGDPISAPRDVCYCCPLNPRAHRYPTAAVERWDEQLRAYCSVDGSLMTLYAPCAAAAPEGA